MFSPVCSRSDRVQNYAGLEQSTCNLLSFILLRECGFYTSYWILHLVMYQICKYRMVCKLKRKTGKRVRGLGEGKEKQQVIVFLDVNLKYVKCIFYVIMKFNNWCIRVLVNYIWMIAAWYIHSINIGLRHIDESEAVNSAVSVNVLE